MQTKTLTPASVQIKNADLGEVEAVFATLGVKDHDGDVIEPGAIKDGSTVAISGWGHSVWKGHRPTGVGTIHEIGNELVMKGRFFLNTDDGRNDFHTVQGLAEADKGEWSFGLQNIEATKTTKDGISANFISAVDVPEVSPVFQGAGIDTRTLAVKGRKQLNSDVRRQLRDLGNERFGGENSYVYPEDYDVDQSFVIFSVYTDGEGDQWIQVGFTRDGDDITLDSDDTEVERTTNYVPAKSGTKFSEHLTTVLADVKALNDRAQGVMALRAVKGKTISDDAATALTSIGEELERIKALLEQPAPPPPEDESEAIDVNNEFARFVALTQGV